MNMQRDAKWMLLLMLPAMGMAAEPLKLTTTGDASKRFISLDGVREASSKKQNGISVVYEKKMLPLRKDQEQINSGFLRIDRARSVAIPAQQTLLTPQAPSTGRDEAARTSPAPIAQSTAEENSETYEEESDEIVGNREAINPVLALFDADDTVVLGSFSDVMRGNSQTANRGEAFWPIPLDAQQYVSSGFGMRADPFHGRQTFHGGIDIATSEGTPVLATHNATVTQVTSDPRYGKYITLEHADGTLSRYGHLSSQSVREGQRVKGGQVIGAVGNTGRSTGAHLDYRVSKNNTKFDPLSILRVPSTVAYKAPRPTQTIAKAAVNVLRGGNGVTMNATPKRAMVIKVQ